MYIQYIYIYTVHIVVVPGRSLSPQVTCDPRATSDPQVTSDPYSVGLASRRPS